MTAVALGFEFADPLCLKKNFGLVAAKGRLMLAYPWGDSSRGGSMKDVRVWPIKESGSMRKT